MSEAWIMAIGAGMGMLSTISGSDDEQNALRKQKETAWRQYLLGKEYSDQQYAINRGEAQTQTAIQQGRLDQSLSQSAEQFNLGLLSQAYGIQNAQIQTASSVGASLAAEGMSGTRGNGAGALMRAYEETNLERNIALQQRGSELSLQGMLGQANDAAADIRRERESWNAGGYRYAQKEAQDAYNLSMAELGQENFDWQIEQADWTVLDLVTGGLQGAASGLSLWNSWNEAQQYADGSGGGKTPKVPAPKPAKSTAAAGTPPTAASAYDTGTSAGFSFDLTKNNPYLSSSGSGLWNNRQIFDFDPWEGF
jgi:hypothetical protein